MCNVHCNLDFYVHYMNFISPIVGAIQSRIKCKNDFMHLEIIRNTKLYVNYSL